MSQLENWSPSQSDKTTDKTTDSKPSSLFTNLAPDLQSYSQLGKSSHSASESLVADNVLPGLSLDGINSSDGGSNFQKSTQHRADAGGANSMQAGDKHDWHQHSSEDGHADSGATRSPGAHANEINQFASELGQLKQDIMALSVGLSDFNQFLTGQQSNGGKDSGAGAATTNAGTGETTIASATAPGAGSGEVTTPTLSTSSGEAATAKPNTSSGEAATAKPSTSSGEAATATPSTSSGEAATATHNTSSGEAVTATPNTGSGEAATATPNTSSGEAATATPNTSSGEAATATPNTSSGEAATSTPNTSSGEAAAPTPNTSSGEAATATPNTSSGEAATSKPTTGSGDTTVASSTTTSSAGPGSDSGTVSASSGSTTSSKSAGFIAVSGGDTNAAEAESLSATLGKAVVPSVFLDWTQPAAQTTQYAVGQYASWVAANPGEGMVVAAPLTYDGQTLASTASGANNSEFTNMAQQLVAAGQGNDTIRLGVEMNGSWATDNNDGNPTDFINAYNNAAEAMKAVPGANFKFVWNPSDGEQNGIPTENYYPGNANVNSIGVDVYDWNESNANATPAQTWNLLTTEAGGLNELATFAQQQGEPFSIPEYAVSAPEGQAGNPNATSPGMGDDPSFVNNIANFLNTQAQAEGVGYQSYFDIASGGVGATLETSPNSYAAYINDFGNGGVAGSET
jgi:hypothetical protein